MQLFNEIKKTNNDYKNVKNDKIKERSTTQTKIFNETGESPFPIIYRKNNNIDESYEFKHNKYNQISNDPNYRITRINIDSGYRDKIPKNILTDTVLLLTNPFSLTYNSNIITIKIQNHQLTTNDKITINNVFGSYFYLKSFEFVKNSLFVKIYHPNHKMQPFDKTKIYNPYQIKIENIAYNNLTLIQNIPLNMLNDYHIVYFNTDGGNTYNDNFYYIQLPIAPNTNTIYNINYKVLFHHLYGVPTSSINANFPVNVDYIKGYHNVNSVIDNDHITIVIDFIANNTISNIGGNNITVNKIIDYIEGYPNNNNYIISLHKTFYNVAKIKLISTEFPYTEKIIKNSSSKKQNNLLYWQIINDGDYLYNIELTSGNYDISGLITEMITQIEKTIRHSNLQSTSTYSYSTTLFSDITINTNTNEFTIAFFGKFFGENPFKISKTTTSGTTRYFIEVNHPNHLLQVGTSITIQNAIDISEVSSVVINNTHIINSIIDENNYVILLNKFNPILTSNTNTNGGGVAVEIIYPLQSRLFFDKPGTLGYILGFRNPGLANSITTWNYINTNKTPYKNDILMDSVGAPINSDINNYINLNGDSYILMTNPLFKNTVNISTVNNIFAKLLLAGTPGSILYNQYIQLGEELIDGIQSLSELAFSFYTNDGILYEFNGLEHSFTLEIYEKLN